jgi:alpha-glucosidase
MRAKTTACAVLAALLSLPAAAQASGGFDEEAVFADGSALYVGPQEPGDRDPVTLKLRTGRGNVDAVLLHAGEAALPMAKLASAGSFDYWFAELAPMKGPTSYYFELKRGRASIFYGRLGVARRPPIPTSQFAITPGFKLPAWMKGAVLYQIYVDRFNNGDETNDVLTNEYLYDNWPAVRVEDWNALPDASRPYAAGGNRTREFFGGDLEGIIQKLGYLKELGVEGIYLSPIFVSPSNHKYDAQDYEHVDPHFGSIVKDGGALVDPARDPNYRRAGASAASTVNRSASKYRIRTTDPANLAASDAKLKELVDRAHELGIRVILDGVFNHSGSFNKWFDREGIYPDEQGPGAYESKSSPFASFYSFAKEAWPNNESYECWAGYKTLPKLAYERSPELERKVLDIGAKWVGIGNQADGPGFGADGWRLDVAAELGSSPKYNHRFWRLFRSSVKAANPDAVILAEVYGNASPWLSGGEWDTVMNYDAFLDPVSWYLTGMEKHSYAFSEARYCGTKAFADELAEKMARLPQASLEAAMNQLDNHDHSRFLTRTSGYVDSGRSSSDVSPQDKAGAGVNKGVLKEAVILQMCMPGAPTLYYGDEAGLAGFTDPDCRRTYPWGREDRELLGFYKDAIALRKEFPVLRTGSFAMLSANQYGLFAFGRWDRSSRILAAVNNYKEPREVEIPVYRLGLAEGETLELVLSADRDSHGRPGSACKVAGGAVTLELPAFGGVVLASRSPSGEPEPRVTARPLVKSVWPAEGASKVPASASISIVFSEAMEQRGIASAFSLEPAARGRFVWNGDKVSFVPDAPLASGRYTATLSKDLRSMRGGFGLAEGRIWSFAVE